MSVPVESAWTNFSANSSVPSFSQGSDEGIFFPGPMSPASCRCSSQGSPGCSTKVLMPYFWQRSATLRLSSPSSLGVFATFWANSLYQNVSWHADSLP